MSRFFSSSKRGELHELKEELHSQDKTRCKDAVKKVIASMTIGKDVSSLFPDVVQCMQSNNIELKKLVYLYVLNYAKTQPELAILAVNTFRKDSTDPNPLIRALAVRTMGCIKLDEVMEYLLDPLRRCCQDQDPYVRKTAAICIPKIYDISPELCQDQGFLEILKDLTGDANPMVVANAVTSLLELQETSGRSDLIILDDQTVSRLLNALNECTEWGQISILDAFATLNAKRVSNIDSLLERVVPRLNHSNQAVVMGAVKVIARFMDRATNADLIRSLQKKLVPPLISLLATEPEIQYVSLRCINLIIQQRPQLLANEIRMFFCKYTDPIYVKLEKLEILIMLVSDHNVEQVLTEFKDYATEIDVDFVRKAIRGIGKIAVKLDMATAKCIAVLLNLVEMKVNYVVQEAVVVIKDIFRKFPMEYERVIGALCENIESLDQPEAKASMIWILGEHAERIENCAEILLTFMEYFQYEPVIVQLQILSASVKFFLKVPSQGQAVVTKVLQLCTEETDNPDLRDRAYFYWRLLSTDPEQTKRVVLGDKPQIRFESSLLDVELLDKLVPQLSLMSSVFHRLHTQFITRSSTASSRGLAGDDEDETEEDRHVRFERIKKQTSMAERGELRDNSPKSDLSNSSDEAGTRNATDLLGMAASSFDPLAGLFGSTPSPKTVVLPRNQPGSGKQVGLEVCASFTSDLKLTLTNYSQSVLSGFAIQINKNFFGFAPSSQLIVNPIQPGALAEVSIALAPNQNLSDKPPSFPLALQVALKTSLDVFYFNVPYELGSALLHTGSRVDAGAWQHMWSSAREVAEFEIQSGKSWDSDKIARVMQTEALFSVLADRDTFCFAGTTVTGVRIFTKITLRSGSLRVEVKADKSELVSLAVAQLNKLLG